VNPSSLLAASSSSSLGTFLPLIVLAVLFYVLVLRPAQRRQRKAAQTASALAPGLEVVTSAGMLATIHAVTDKHVELEIAPGVIVRYVKGAIARVVPPEEPEALDGDESADSSTQGDQPTT
jgi:preprotein translocase subunit YajC